MRVKDICNLQNGRAFKQSDWGSEGVPIIRIQNLNNESAPFNYYVGEYDSVHEIDNGELLFSWSGTPGTSFGAFRWYRGKGVLNHHIFKVIPKIEVNKDYLKYALNGNIQTIIAKAHGGVGLQHITKKELEEIDIPIIPLKEQTEIVDRIVQVERIIFMRKQELKKLDNLIKARFVEMFGHQSHNEKGLPYLTIDDVAEIYLGITHTPTYVNQGVMFISAKNTSGDFLDLSDVKYISREEFEKAPKGSKPQVNDILFSRVGSNLGHPVILEEDLELCTFVSLGFLRTKGKVTSNYLKHWMRDDFFSNQVKEHVKGGGQPNLNTGWLKEFKIIVPNIELQKVFDKFCRQVDKSKAAVQKALDETQLLFDSLMQEYFG